MSFWPGAEREALSPVSSFEAVKGRETALMLLWGAWEALGVFGRFRAAAPPSSQASRFAGREAASPAGFGAFALLELTQFKVLGGLFS